MKPDDGGCPNGGVTLHMYAPPCYQYSLGFQPYQPYLGEDGSWFNIDGQNFANYAGSNICQGCQFYDYPIGLMTSYVPSGGVTWTWNGTVTATGSSFTCVGSYPGYAISCEPLLCVPPGHYSATMCATSPNAAGYDDACVTVDFDYPTTSEVVGTIELPDGGVACSSSSSSG